MLAYEARSSTTLLCFLAVNIDDICVREESVFICLLVGEFLGEAFPGAIPAVRKFLCYMKFLEPLVPIVA